MTCIFPEVARYLLTYQLPPSCFDSGDSYTVYSVESQQFPNTVGWFYPIGRLYEFQIQTCGSAEITLANIPFKPDTRGYRITLGEVSSIAKLPSGGTPEVSVDTPRLLHCYVLRTFWISWSDGLRVGKGRNGFNQIMEYLDPSPWNIAALAIQTPAPAPAGGEWQVNKERGIPCVV